MLKVTDPIGTRVLAPLTNRQAIDTEVFCSPQAADKLSYEKKLI